MLLLAEKLCSARKERISLTSAFAIWPGPKRTSAMATSRQRCRCPVSIKPALTHTGPTGSLKA